MKYTIENIRLGSKPGHYSYYIKVRRPNGKCLMSGKVRQAIITYLKNHGYLCMDAGLCWEHDAIHYSKSAVWSQDGDYITPDPQVSIGSELALAVTIMTGHDIDAVDYDDVR